MKINQNNILYASYLSQISNIQREQIKNGELREIKKQKDSAIKPMSESTNTNQKGK